MSSHRWPAPSTLKLRVAIVAIAGAVSLPCLIAGIPAGHDADYHVTYQYHFSRQLWSGDLYPRWLTGANKGYGSPVFLLQYPLPYYMSALVGELLPFSQGPAREARQLGLVCFLAIAAAGLAAFAWLRNRCRPIVAAGGAAVYVLLPYVLGQDLYVRAALGELWGLAWMPAALACCDRLRPTFRSVAALALVLALLILSHAITAALFMPVLLLYFFAISADRAMAVSSEPARPPVSCHAGFVVAAMVLGVGISAVYVFPLLAYRQVYDPQALQAASPTFELGRWFLFVTSKSLSSRLFILALVGTLASSLGAAVFVWLGRGSRAGRIGMLAVLGLGVLVMVPNVGPLMIRLGGLSVLSFDESGDFAARALFTSLFELCAGFVAYRLLSPATNRERALLSVACVAFVLMLPWSASLWWLLGGIANSVQFPFRFGLVLAVAVTGLIASAADQALRDLETRNGRVNLIALGAATIWMIVMGGLTWQVLGRFRHPRTATSSLARNVDDLFRSYVRPENVAAFERRIGAAHDSFEVALTPLDVDTVRAECIGSDGVAAVTQVRPRVLEVSAQCGGSGAVRIFQLDSRLWTAASVGDPSAPPVLRRSGDGLIEAQLSEGQRRFRLTFDLGWPERAGFIVTVLSVLAAGVGCALDRRARKKG